MEYKIRVELEKGSMAKEIKLPEPKEKGSTSIEEALNKRRSVRDYKKGPLRLEQISQLLWAASGKNLYRRTVPSAGATYPLETYLVVGEVEGNKLSQAASGQRMIEQAPINIIIAADYGRTTSHYGQRGIRYVHMEVGHVGQNISLQANALSLGAVMVGAFDDQEVKEVLGIKEEPLYLIPVGRI
jgi:nitroreductase